MNNSIPTILIVDDLEINLLILRSILESEGFFVLEAQDGISAREKAIREKPDLILLDIMMPGENGFITCSKLKMESATNEIPILFISSLDDVEKKVEGFRVGAMDYITKPFENEEVLARIKLQLRLSNSRKRMIEDQKNKLKNLTEAQQDILIKPEVLPKANFSVKYLPVLEAGGDFYDVIRFSEDVYGYFCADVSGHDLGSSLATSAFKALIHQNSGLLYSPRETMQMVNSVLKNVLGDDIFLTAVYVMLNRRKKKMKIVSTGHPPIILLPKDGNAVPVKVAGDLLGFFDTIVLEEVELTVSKDDRFYLYTDGLIEEDGDKKIPVEQGIQRLVKQINKTKEINLKNSIDQILTGLFPRDKRVSDDILLMGVEV